MSALQELHELRPYGGFDLIMADPPWSFSLRSDKGEAKSPQAQYDCMPTEDIAQLPVAAIAADDCLLWLWATNPMLPQALDVMQAWGFRFRTAGTWVKRTRHGKTAFGTGYILRSANEPFLIGVRGRPVTSRSVRSVVESGESVADALGITIEARVREHSRKPDEAFEAARRLMPDARRIELFSRETRSGWASWGMEAGKFDAHG